MGKYFLAALSCLAALGIAAGACTTEEVGGDGGTGGTASGTTTDGGGGSGATGGTGGSGAAGGAGGTGGGGGFQLACDGDGFTPGMNAMMETLEGAGYAMDAMSGNDIFVYQAESTDVEPIDILFVETYPSAGGLDAPGTHVFTGETYADCVNCLLIFEGCVDDNGEQLCDRGYLAIEGTLEFTRAVV